jgi:hypothetical protein
MKCMICTAVLAQTCTFSHVWAVTCVYSGICDWEAIRAVKAPSPKLLLCFAGGVSHGVLLLNSNGMDVTLEPQQLTYR